MISEHTIYCVGCRSVIDIEKAEIIFRTGFYKVSMQLGICTACESKERLLETTSRIDPLNQFAVAIEERTSY